MSLLLYSAQLFSSAWCYCYIVTPPSGTLRHFTEVQTELLLNRFVKPSLLFVQIKLYEMQSSFVGTLFTEIIQFLPLLNMWTPY